MRGLKRAVRTSHIQVGEAQELSRSANFSLLFFPFAFIFFPAFKGFHAVLAQHEAAYAACAYCKPDGALEFVGVWRVEKFCIIPPGGEEKRGEGNMFCQKCGAEIKDGAKQCQNCGALQDGAKFCKYCGEAVDKDCVVCPKCGKQIGQLKMEQPNIVINNTNTNTNANFNRAGGPYGRPINKWVSFVLCLLFGYFGAHKFYEGRAGMGVLYLFTLGLFSIGWIIDIFAILLKPNPYYVYR